MINLKTHKLLNSKPEYGSLYLQARYVIVDLFLT